MRSVVFGRALAQRVPPRPRRVQSGARTGDLNPRTSSRTWRDSQHRSRPVCRQTSRLSRSSGACACERCPSDHLRFLSGPGSPGAAGDRKSRSASFGPGLRTNESILAQFNSSVRVTAYGGCPHVVSHSAPCHATLCTLAHRNALRGAIMVAHLRRNVRRVGTEGAMQRC
jgi:hypothetical protein